MRIWWAAGYHGNTPETMITCYVEAITTKADLHQSIHNSSLNIKGNGTNLAVKFDYTVKLQNILHGLVLNFWLRNTLF